MNHMPCPRRHARLDFLLQILSQLLNLSTSEGLRNHVLRCPFCACRVRSPILLDVISDFILHPVVILICAGISSSIAIQSRKVAVLDRISVDDVKIRTPSDEILAPHDV